MKIRIKEVCQRCNITQKELAEKLGVSEVTLSRASNGNTSIALLEKISNTLNIDVSDLFTSNHDNVSFHCPHCGAQLEIKVQKTK